MNIFLKSKNIKDECISDIVSLGDFVYISAQFGQGNTIQKQTRSALEDVVSCLQEFNMAMHHLVKATVYLTDLEGKQPFLDVYKTYFEAPFPACSIVEVSRLEHDAKVAIEAVAINTLRYEKEMKDHSCKDCAGC